MNLDIDPNNLTLEEIELLEDATGQPFGALFREGDPVLDENGKPKIDENGNVEREVNMPIKTIAALIWLGRRKTEPEITLDEVKRTTNMADVSRITFGPRPTRAARRSGSKTLSSSATTGRSTPSKKRAN